MRKSIVPIVVLVLLSACAQPGELPLPVIRQSTTKGIPYVDYGIERFRAIEFVCYIDTSQYNPLNALDYTLKDSGLQLFDYVVLGGAFLKVDSRGYYIDLSDDLMAVIVRRNTLITPLQRKGIKVLLGIQSFGMASFGNVTEDEMTLLARDIFEILSMYRLDGLEFYDNGDSAAYPPYVSEYNPDNEEALTREAWELEMWKKGGDTFNNFFYTIRYKYDAYVREDIPMFLRELNYGRYFPDNVSCTSGMADFASSGAQITYSFNNNSPVFKEHSDQRYANEYGPGGNPNSWILNPQFGPFFLELDGGSRRNIFYPQFEKTDTPDTYWGEEISYFARRFLHGDYQAIYCHNLKAVSEAKSDLFYVNFFFSGDPDAPNAEEFESPDDFWQNSKTIPPYFIFSLITQILLGEDVVCSGGDHVKNW